MTETLAKKVKALAGTRRKFHTDLEWRQFINMVIRACLAPRNRQINILKRRVRLLEAEVAQFKTEAGD